MERYILKSENLKTHRNSPLPFIWLIKWHDETILVICRNFTWICGQILRQRDHKNEGWRLIMEACSEAERTRRSWVHMSHDHHHHTAANSSKVKKWTWGMFQKIQVKSHVSVIVSTARLRQWQMLVQRKNSNLLSPGYIQIAQGRNDTTVLYVLIDWLAESTILHPVALSAHFIPRVNQWWCEKYKWRSNSPCYKH